MIYLRKFDNHAAYEAAESSLILPNVSLITENNKVEYNPLTPPAPTAETRLVLTYNVEYEGENVRLLYDTTRYFSSMEIDGVEQQSVVGNYTFSTIGEHTVKYTLTDPTTIGEQTFMECGNLTSVVLPNGVTGTGYNAFDSCGGLTSVTIPFTTAVISENCFSGCDGLVSITIPDSVTRIGSGAFWNCSNLTSVAVGSGLEKIDACAFYGCSSLDAASIAALEAADPNAFYCD